MPNWVNPCATCPKKYRAIGGDGPRPAPILCIAERPGQDENKHGRVLVGKTGVEFDELYLPLAGLDRSEVRVCNTVMCWADSNKTPTDKEVNACASCHIPDEIEKTDPAVIVLMGASACKLVPGIKLELHHGIPQSTAKVGTLFGWSGWLVPMYHPSIGLHESRWMKICMDDWKFLKDIIAADYFAYDPEGESCDYQIAHVSSAIDDSYKGCGSIAVDTESHGGTPWSVQCSATPRVGYLVKLGKPEAVSFLRRLFAEKELIFHNAAYDLEVLRRLGIEVKSYRDTMQEAFHLGNLPQGLKPLVYRLFRHTMTSYDETVRPASIVALQEWMLEAFAIAQSDLAYTTRRQLKTKVKETVAAGELETLLTRLLRLTDVSSDYDPWARLDAFYDDPLNSWMTDHVQARIGRYPLLGIANCSMADAVRYAVGDADYTARVAVELARRRGESFKIFEGDRDA